MGKVSVTLPEKLEDKLRELAYKRFKGKKGALSKIIIEALERYLK